MTFRLGNAENTSKTTETKSAESMYPLFRYNRYCYFDILILDLFIKKSSKIKAFFKIVLKYPFLNWLFDSNILRFLTEVFPVFGSAVFISFPQNCDSSLKYDLKKTRGPSVPEFQLSSSLLT